MWTVNIMLCTKPIFIETIGGGEYLTLPHALWIGFKRVGKSSYTFCFFLKQLKIIKIQICLIFIINTSPALLHQGRSLELSIRNVFEK